jgi:hypothetical protein
MVRREGVALQFLHLSAGGGFIDRPSSIIVRDDDEGAIPPQRYQGA